MKQTSKTEIKTQDFHGLQLATSDSFDDGEPRCRDLDLGKFLGYSRPRKVRELIEREIKAGNLSDSDVRPVVGRVTAGGRPRKDGTAIPSVEMDVTEFWLTLSAGLFVAARSETKVGAELLKSLIEAWTLARMDKRVHNILQLCWAKEPKPVQAMFAPLIRALLDLRDKDESPNPPWARLLASMCYAWAFGPDWETGQQRHRRNTEPDCKRRDYWWLNEDGLRQLQRVIDTGIDYTFQAIDWDQWVAMMRRRYEGRPIQLYFAQPKMLRASRKKAVNE
jgi:hypothetical protein